MKELARIPQENIRQDHLSMPRQPLLMLTVTSLTTDRPLQLAFWGVPVSLYCYPTLLCSCTENDHVTIVASCITPESKFNFLSKCYFFSKLHCL